MTHPAKDLLYAIADGKRIDHKSSCGNWYICHADDALKYISDGCATDLRIARPMVERTVRYPEPLRVKPERGEFYFHPDTMSEKIDRYRWTGGGADNRIFAAGMAFATEADAAEAHRALFGAQT